MGREGLLAALAVLVATAFVFALWPQLDLVISGLFFTPRFGFWENVVPLLDLVRLVSMWPAFAIGIASALLLPLRLVFPRVFGFIGWRPLAFLVTSVLLAPLLLVNSILKDLWDRARPVQVHEFGGPWSFTPWYRPGMECDTNCSFVSGEMSGAMWLLAPAALLPPRWRGIGYGAVLVYSAFIGLLRIAYGGHFFSDVVFSAVFTYLVIFALYHLFLRRT